MNLKVDFLLKAFNKKKKIKRKFERFNLNRCFYYSIHTVILITACKPDPRFNIRKLRGRERERAKSFGRLERILTRVSTINEFFN